MVHGSAAVIVEHAAAIGLEVTGDCHGAMNGAIIHDSGFDGGFSGSVAFAGGDVYRRAFLARQVCRFVAIAAFQCCAIIQILIVSEPAAVTTPTLGVAGNQPLLGQVCGDALFQQYGFEHAGCGERPARTAATLVFDTGVVSDIIIRLRNRFDFDLGDGLVADLFGHIGTEVAELVDGILHRGVVIHAEGIAIGHDITTHLVHFKSVFRSFFNGSDLVDSFPGVQGGDKYHRCHNDTNEQYQQRNFGEFFHEGLL